MVEYWRQRTMSLDHVLLPRLLGNYSAIAEATGLGVYRTHPFNVWGLTMHEPLSAVALSVFFSSKQHQLWAYGELDRYRPIRVSGIGILLFDWDRWVVPNDWIIAR